MQDYNTYWTEGKKKDEGFAQIGSCEFAKTNNNRKDVQIPHGNCKKDPKFRQVLMSFAKKMAYRERR